MSYFLAQVVDRTKVKGDPFKASLKETVTRQQGRLRLEWEMTL